MKNRTAKRNPCTNLRFTVLLCTFVAVMLFYVGVMAKLQIEGAKDAQVSEAAYTRQVTVSGLRGEIYDRNGVLLVGNSTSYDLIFEYGAIPDTTYELNNSILETLKAIEETGSGASVCEDHYPLAGSYPKLSFTSDAVTGGTEVNKHLLRVLEANGLDTEVLSAEKLTDTLISKYKLRTSLYTEEEIDKLLRVRYAMEKIKFGVYQPFTLASKVSMDLVTYVEEAGIDGVTLKVNSERTYKYPGYASHILGRLGKIQAEDSEYYDSLGYSMDAYVGTSGCEKAFESHLRGQDGIMEISYNEDGIIIGKEYLKEPISGNDVYLTIDIELQMVAEDALKKTVDDLTFSNSGAIVSLEPNTGEILVIASYPTYDLTGFSSVDYYNSLLQNTANPLFDRALLGEYAPGSIYKIGTALAALEQSAITDRTILRCDGVFPHLHRPTCLGVGGVDGKHGDLNVIKAIALSCNCFFYELGMEMGIDSVTPYTLKLGLGADTGIELPERLGSVPGTQFRIDNNLTAWEAGDDLSAAIGQSDHTYSPLQMGVFTSSVVNGGNRYSAHLLKCVKKFYTNEVIYEYSPTVLSSVGISNETYNTLIEGMRQVVTESASLSRYFSSVGVTVGGKTGTAEVSGGKKDTALFAAFAPLNDPKIVSVCVLEEGVNGGNAAIPISKVFEKYFEN